MKRTALRTVTRTVATVQAAIVTTATAAAPRHGDEQRKESRNRKLSLPARNQPSPSHPRRIGNRRRPLDANGRRPRPRSHPTATRRTRTAAMEAAVARHRNPTSNGDPDL